MDDLIKLGSGFRFPYIYDCMLSLGPEYILRSGPKTQYGAHVPSKGT